MTLRNLEVFLAVVETGSMRSAAERLYISQPSVSGVVSDLESEYHIRLFERLGKKLFITPEGERLAGYARRMLALNAELERQMRTAEAESPLRVGATVTVGASVMPELLQQLDSAPPYVFVGNTGMIEQKLLRNELDAALVEGRPQSEDLVVTPVIRDRLMLICPTDHPMAKQASVRIEELDGVPLVMREPESGTRHVLDQEFADAGAAMHLAWECNNTQALLEAVRSGFGVAILSPRLLRGVDGLTAVHIESKQMERWFSLMLHKDKFLRPRLQEFLNLCRIYE